MRIKSFGAAREILGEEEMMWDEEIPFTVGDLRQKLGKLYPGLSKLRFYMIAVNEEYAEDKDVLQGGEVIAIIPPVSGG